MLGGIATLEGILSSQMYMERMTIHAKLNISDNRLLNITSGD